LVNFAACQESEVPVQSAVRPPKAVNKLRIFRGGISVRSSEGSIGFTMQTPITGGSRKNPDGNGFIAEVRDKREKWIENRTRECHTANGIHP